MTLSRGIPPPPVGGAEVSGRNPPADSLLKATLWTLGGEAAAHPIRIISSLILTRLLFPKDFGLMAVVQVFMAGLSMFSDLGTRPIIIRHERGDDPDFLNTVWTVRLIRGAVLGLASCAIAWPVARFYGEPSLAYLVPVSGLTLFLDGLMSTKFFSYDRKLSRARPTIINVASSVIAVIFMIVWAWAYRSVWALVWGNVVGTLVKILMSHWWLLGPNNRFQWDREAWNEVAHFGKWVFLNSVVTFLALQMDKLVFAKLIPLSMLGVYSIATNIVQLPTAAVHAVAQSVAFPAFSRARLQLDDLAAMFDRMRQLLLLGGGACLSFLILNGPWLIELLYDPRYHAAGWILQISTIGGWFAILEVSHGLMLLTLGHPRWLTLASALKVLAMLIAVPLSWKAFGFTGALVAVSIVEAVRYVFECAWVRRSGLKSWAYERMSTGLVLACGVAAVLIQYAPLTTRAPVLRGFLSFGAFTAVWLPVGLSHLGKLRRAA